MNKKEITLIIILILIIINFYYSDYTAYTINGEIKEIKYSENIVRIKIVGEEIDYVLFTNRIIDLKEKDKIIIKGKKDIYKSKEQIIVAKITKIS